MKKRENQYKTFKQSYILKNIFKTEEEMNKLPVSFWEKNTPINKPIDKEILLEMYNCLSRMEDTLKLIK
jgi:hypothetical protein